MKELQGILGENTGRRNLYLAWMRDVGYSGGATWFVFFSDTLQNVEMPGM